MLGSKHVGALSWERESARFRSLSEAQLLSRTLTNGSYPLLAPLTGVSRGTKVIAFTRRHSYTVRWAWKMHRYQPSCYVRCLEFGELCEKKKKLMQAVHTVLTVLRQDSRLWTISVIYQISLALSIRKKIHFFEQTFSEIIWSTARINFRQQLSSIQSSWFISIITKDPWIKKLKSREKNDGRFFGSSFSVWNLREVKIDVLATINGYSKTGHLQRANPLALRWVRYAWRSTGFNNSIVNVALRVPFVCSLMSFLCLRLYGIEGQRVPRWTSLPFTYIGLFHSSCWHGTFPPPFSRTGLTGRQIMLEKTTPWNTKVRTW